MRNIRKGVFETNSSSVHSICISNDAVKDLPGFVKFGRQMFGREGKVYYNIEDKAAYLYEAIMAIEDEYKRDKYWWKVQDYLTMNGIAFEKDYTGPDYTQIDHGDLCSIFVDAVCNDYNLLERYLFSKKTKIQCFDDEYCEYCEHEPLVESSNDEFTVFVKAN